jgi:hypothetical protein
MQRYSMRSTYERKSESESVAYSIRNAVRLGCSSTVRSVGNSLTVIHFLTTPCCFLLLLYQQADIQYWEETLEGELEGIKEIVSISL